MVQIDLYQPGKVSTSITFPSGWNELTLKELHTIAQSILLNFKNATEAKAMVFLSIFKNRCKEAGLPQDYVKKLDAEDCAMKSIELTEFVYKANELTKQPYPVLQVAFNNCPLVPKKEMIGPEDDFNNLTAGEYEDCEIHYMQFREDPDPKHLAQMAAILYRPKDTKYLQFNAATNEYVKYDTEKVAKKLLITARQQPWILYTIYLWYIGCSNQLRLIFPQTYSGGKQSEPDLLAFTKVIHAAAGPKNGNRQEVRCTLLKELLFESEQEIIKANELAEYYERNK